MNDVRLHVPYIFGNKQNSKTEKKRKQIQKKAQLKTEKYQERPMVGPDRLERGNANSR